MKYIINLSGLLILLVLNACSAPGELVYGTTFSNEPLAVFDKSEGIHPSKAVLNDPNNPFARAPSGAETKWDIQSADNRVAAFYSWATWLANEPTGEHQYYVALNLAGIWSNGVARQEDLPKVRQMAIDAYQSVLDNFLDAATYDITGTFSFELLTPAFNGILGLGGTPSGGWVLVQGPDGNPKAVRP